jgi:Tol biopolymer transport system component
MDTATQKKVRLTHFPGADVLPVFNADGTKIMWTSTRNEARQSQIYIADFVPPKVE